MENNYASTNSNSHYMTKSSPFYYGEQMKHWANTPMSYALDIAIEYYFSNLLEFPLDRIIYSSNEYCFRERTRKNNGELNLPFLNYYRVGYDTSDKLWFNDFTNRFHLHDLANSFTTKMGGRMRVYPVNLEYEASVFFAQNKDCEYAMNKLLFDGSNETIITPQLEMANGDILQNAGVLNLEVEYNPTYQESDWLEQNRIWSIGIDFTVRTFMIGKFNDDSNLLHVAKSVLLQFFSAKKLNKNNYTESEQIEMLLSEYFGETN